MQTFLIVVIVLVIILFIYKKFKAFMEIGSDAGLGRSTYDDDYHEELEDTPAMRKLKEHALGTNSTKS